MGEIEFLKGKARLIREDIIKMVSGAKSGHPGGALGLADIFAVLYFHVLRHKPKDPNWDKRDRLIMSNGHACAVRYSAMSRAGYFPVNELGTFRRLGSRLQGHPSLHDLPGVESSSGSLGQGLGVAVGMSLASKLDKKSHNVFCMISEGDLDEGSTWESINAANKWSLDNLIVIVDRNNIQISGKTKDIWPIEPLNRKFESFNWHVIETDGHNITKLLSAFNRAIKTKKPCVIIAKTTLGKGVSFMENNPVWHGKPPSKEEADSAIKQLRIK